MLNTRFLLFRLSFIYGFLVPGGCVHHGVLGVMLMVACGGRFQVKGPHDGSVDLGLGFSLIWGLRRILGRKKFLVQELVSFQFLFCLAVLSSSKPLRL